MSPPDATPGPLGIRRGGNDPTGENYPINAAQGSTIEVGVFVKNTWRFCQKPVESCSPDGLGAVAASRFGSPSTTERETDNG
jgi:hypothetical protein